jgi:hypothetical protein
MPKNLFVFMDNLKIKFILKRIKTFLNNLNI